MRITPASVQWDKSIQGPSKEVPTTSSPTFVEELKAKINEVDQLHHQADDAMKEGAVNGAQQIHETMIRLEEADISMRLLVKVRNKALEAYQEIMRMQF